MEDTLLSDVDEFAESVLEPDTPVLIGQRREVIEEDEITPETAVRRIVLASELSAKNRDFEVVPYISALAASASQRGLDTDALTTILDVLVSATSQLERNHATTLLKNLYPRGRVPKSCVITIVGSLGPGTRRVNAGVQVQLIRWLIAVYDVLEHDACLVLGKLYGVLFGLLDAITIRAPLCQLLAMITRRRHIRRYRIQQLLDLCHKTGNEKPLIGLLQVYKDYYPDIVLSNLISTRAKFRDLDPDWKAHLHSIQVKTITTGQAEERGNGSFHLGSARHLSGFQVRRDVHARPHGGAAGLIPVASSHSGDEFSVTLEEIDSAKSLASKLERIEAPAQMVSVLQDPLVQKLMLLRPDSDTQSVDRLEMWLNRFFDDEIAWAKSAGRTSNRDSRRLREMLETLVPFTTTFQEILPSVRRFFEAYLPLWDGSTNVDSISAILKFLPIEKFERLQRKILVSFETKVLGQPRGHYRILTFYRGLLFHWGTIIGNGTSPSLFTTPTSVTSQSEQELQSLVKHTTILALSAVALDPPDPSATNAAQLFYRAIPFISNPTKFPSPKVKRALSAPSINLPFPPAPLLFHFLVSPLFPDICAASSIILAYKPVLSNRPTPAEHEAQAYNSLILETTDLFWRSRAFSGALSASLPRDRYSKIPVETRDKLSSWLAERVGSPPVSPTTPVKIGGTAKQDYLADTYSLGRHIALATIAEWVFAKYCCRKGRERWVSRGKTRRSTENTGGPDGGANTGEGEEGVNDDDNDDDDEDSAAAMMARLNRAISSAKQMVGPGVSKSLITYVSKSQNLDMDWQEFRVELLDWLKRTGAGGLTDLLKGTMRGLRKEGRSGSRTPAKQYHPQ